MIFIVFFMVNLSLIKLRFVDPGRKRPFKIPFSIGRLPLLPSLGAVSAVFLFSQLNAESVIYGLVFAAIGLLIVILKTRKSNF
jgi:amino acid transporter